ncbi:MAG: hypothetical protein HC910_11015 [Spirulinaceae cyanobacterium SM2_1_0]|nr:hypothetical protein [Spirulinaceae cyanobacterium SM2_1_0]
MKLLCLSNGHGEDLIAVNILEQLRQQSPAIEVAALPLVGEGRAYARSDIPISGPVKAMPSGGFIYMDGRQLWNDVRGGLLGLTLAQYRLVRQWRRQGGKILAVGDIVPLLFAWLSGCDYAFVGTAKSEYYLRNEAGWLSRSRSLEGWSGSVYLPWERWLMSRSRCRAVFPRDSLTASVLKQFKIPASDLGNPMMDGIQPELPLHWSPNADAAVVAQRPLVVLLLPGSRAPEAYNNWQLILAALQSLVAAMPARSLLALGAIAPALQTNPLIQALNQQGWQHLDPLPAGLPFYDPNAISFTLPQASSPPPAQLPGELTAYQAATLPPRTVQLLLTQSAYNSCLTVADFAIALAGTATEQFVGLGKPVVTLPGRGPQFTPQFAEAQTRLLGTSVFLVPKPAQVGKTIAGMLANPDLLQVVAENGERRMGKPGAAARMAARLRVIFATDCRS